MDKNIVDMVNAAAEGKPNDFMNAVKDELNDRIMSQIETGRQEYIDHVFNNDQEYEDDDVEFEDDEEQEHEEEDLEVEEEDQDEEV